MEKHLATIEYIKDILEDDELNITFKKGKYVIKFIFDAKNSMTIDAIAKLRAIGKKTTAESKLSTYFPKELFKIVMETINEPERKLMVMDSFSGNVYKKILEQRIIHRPINVNTTDAVLNNVDGISYSTTGINLNNLI
jgi:hypothetical protein